MRIIFEQDFQDGQLKKNKGDIIDGLSKNTSIEILNDKYLILILNGLRYDIPRNVVTII